MHNIEKIESEKQYLEYLSKIEELWDNIDFDIENDQNKYFNHLVELVADYEKEHYFHYSLEGGLE